MAEYSQAHLSRTPWGVGAVPGGLPHGARLPVATLEPDTTEARSGATPAPRPHRSCCRTAVSAARDKEAGPGHPGPIPLIRQFQSPTPTKGAKTEVSLLSRSGLGTRESPQDSPTGPGRTGQQTCPAWHGKA